MIRLIVRLLDANQQLLGWGELWARMPGDGTLRATGPLQVFVECGGVPAWTSVHWADANVEVRTLAESVKPLVAGDTVTLDWDRQPVIRLGTPPVELPCTVMRQSLVLSPPTATMGVQPGPLQIT